MFHLKKFAALSLLCITSIAVAQSSFVPPRTEYGHPDLQGNWQNNLLTPFERPIELGTKQSYSKQEAENLLTQTVNEQSQRTLPSSPDRGAPPVGEIITNVADANFIPELYSEIAIVNGEYRTSLIIEPENGRLPRRAEAKDYYQEFFYQGYTAFDDVKLRPANERCLANPGQLPVTMPIPPGDSRTLQIVQTEDHVVIFGEYATAIRIVPLIDEFPQHAWPNWRGVSIGRWQANTLVVNTRHFRPELSHWRLPASGELEVREEFTLLGPNKLLYRYTFSDPKVFTEPFTAELPLNRMNENERLFESACHEGNYALSGVLAGARRSEIDIEVQNNAAKKRP